MISAPFVLHTALIIVVLFCLQLLRRAGGGREIITISRRSRTDVETSWSNLVDAWDKTGLTFMPADVHDMEEDGMRHVISKRAPDLGSLVLKPLPAPTSHSLVFSVVSQYGVEMPPEIRHFEHWSVEPDGAGSRIVLRTRFRSTLGGTIRNLWALWKQVGIAASADAKETIAAFGTQPAAGQNRPSSPARNLPATRLPSHYGREAMISLVAFAYLLTQYSWRSAVILAGVILWHEYGHLLAYRMTGRTGNRLMLVPFFGGVAVAGAPHRSEFEKAFCALMGPGICAPLTLGTFALWYYDIAPEFDAWFWTAFYFSAILNLLNLLPIYPLDGGQTAESFLRSFLPSSIPVHLSGLSVAGLVVLVGCGFHEMALFVGLFSVMGLRNLPAHSPLPAMSGIQAAVMAIFYAGIVAVHGGVFYYIS